MCTVSLIFFLVKEIFDFLQLLLQDRQVKRLTEFVALYLKHICEVDQSRLLGECRCSRRGRDAVKKGSCTSSHGSWLETHIPETQVVPKVTKTDGRMNGRYTTGVAHRDDFVDNLRRDEKRGEVVLRSAKIFVEAPIEVLLQHWIVFNFGYSVGIDNSEGFAAIHIRCLPQKNA